MLFANPVAMRGRCPVTLTLAASDLAAAALSPVAALYLRNLFDDRNMLDVWSNNSGAPSIVYAVSSAVASLIFLLGMGCSKATWRYFSSRDAFRAANAIAFGIMVGVIVSFAHDRLESVARAVPFLQIFVQVSAFVGSRLFFRRVFHGDPPVVGKAKQVLVVGCNKTALTYLHAVRELSRGSIEVAGLLSEDPTMLGRTIRGKKVLGTIAELGKVVDTLHVHGIDIWKLAVATPDNGFSRADEQVLGAATDQLALPTVDIHAALSMFAAPEKKLAVKREQQPADLKPLYAFAKRTIDLTAGSVLLLVASPLMLLLCAVVAIDVGFPILFWQHRLGRNGKHLTVYKFRTMRAPLDKSGRRIPDSQRISIVGRWMRKLRFDELPQLITIVKGDMSFVGPRPLLPIDQPSDAARRLAVKPGLTGWAQVHGGNLVAIDDKNALDLWYVAHSSFWLDIGIALRTIRMIMQGDSLDGQRIEQAKSWMRTLEFAASS